MYCITQLNAECHLLDVVFLFCLLSFALLFFFNSNYFLCSYDDKVACVMILDKMGLKGYEVIVMFPPTYFPDHATCILDAHSGFQILLPPG